MKVGSGFASGPQAHRVLAEEAVAAALAAAGTSQAEHVLLLLSREFSRHPADAVLAAARSAGCLQVSG
ncbi:MAG: histidine kinase, partial [Dechloromonas sp.]